MKRYHMFSAKVNVAFYVNNDGLIPSGEYSFSNSETKSPFTFDSGVFTLDYGSDSYSTQSDQIVDSCIWHDIFRNIQWFNRLCGF